MTIQLMKKYKDNDKVVYIQHEKNKNGAAARNTGIKAAKGLYVAFLDDDDEFLPTKLEKQVNYLRQHSEFDAVYTGRYQNGKIFSGDFIGDLSEHILLETFTPMTSTLMFKKSALMDINGFNEGFRRHQDYEMLLRFFKSHCIGAIQEPLVTIGVNCGENELHGENLERTKKLYLKTFSDDIRSLDAKKPGFSKKVYIKNYRFMLFDHLSQKRIGLALKNYNKGCKVSFLGFHRSIIEYVFIYLKVQNDKKKSAKHEKN
jgi:glycosyltransferase involved in cell wall biosynthesis